MSNVKILWREFVEEGAVTPDHFIPAEASQLTVDDLKDGDVLVELISISVDPYMRVSVGSGDGWFRPCVATGSVGTVRTHACLLAGTHAKHEGLFRGPLPAR